MACLINIRFNDGGAYDYMDSSRVFSATNGTYNYDEASPFGGSVANRCLTFTDDGVLATDSIAALNRGTGDWTMCCWVKRFNMPGTKGADSMYTICSGRTGSLATIGDWSRVSALANTGTTIGLSSGRTKVISSTNLTSTVNTWHWIVFERLNGVVHVWQNGVKFGSLTSNTTATFDMGMNGFNLNSDTYTYSGNFGRAGATGAFDDFCFFDEALFTDTDAPIDVPDTYFLDFDGSGGKNSYQITEKYQDQAGNELKADVVKTVAEGDDFSTTAPNIAGYKIVGYKVDGGTLVAGSTVTLSSVDASHTVIFVYEKIDDGNGDDDGNCNCRVGFIPIIFSDNEVDCKDIASLLSSLCKCNK